VIGLGYDVQGNLSNKNGKVFDFDFGNRLRGVNGIASYVYDVAGRRVRDYTTASKYSLYAQDGRLMYSTDGRLGVSTQYVYLGGSLVAFREAVGTVITPKYQHTDALGSPITVTGADKAVLERSEYEPYGQVVNATTKDGPGFTGHVLDAATGMNYMQQRYYDPQIGRFLSVDPVTAYSNPVGAFNRYAYAEGNPYTNTDPDGRACNGKGCWVSSEERAAAESGDWRGYYSKAAENGDRYAARGLEVATNTGSTILNAWLSNKTNAFLAKSIADTQGYKFENLTTAQRVDIEKRMEGIRRDLVLGHMRALDTAGATPENPVSLPRGAIGAFHDVAFQKNGADPKAFGGYKMDAAENILNLFGQSLKGVYDYCPAPSCKN
jgi:RHS repeat-associated protein